MKPPLKLSSSNCVPFRCDFFFTWKNYWLDYIPSCQIVFGCLELKNKKLGDNCVLSCFQLSVVLRYLLGSLFQVNMVLGDRCTFTFVEGHANWNEGTTCSAPWSEIHVLASLGSEFLERLQFGRGFFFNPPHPDLYRQSCWSDVYRFTFFPYIKKKLGSSSFLVRNPTWFLQGHPFFLLHDVCSLLVREINFVLVSYRIMYWLKIIYIMRGLQSLRNNPIFFIY